VKARRAILCLLLVAVAASADEPAPAPFKVRLEGPVYLATLDIERVFTAAVREKIDSGLTTRIVLRASVIDLADRSVQSLSVIEYRILYRVWEEDYVVRRWSALGETADRLKRYDDVLRRVGRLKRLPVAGRDDLAAGRRFQAVVEVEVDPVSEELLARVREYLSNPGGHRRDDGDRGLFGNLARIFFDPQSGPNPKATELRSEPFVGRGKP
jgi:hypothetical protein